MGRRPAPAVRRRGGAPPWPAGTGLSRWVSPGVVQTTHVLAGRYELGSMLGQGGMASVHRGLDRRLRRQVAIKVLASPFDRDQAFVERFRREARAAAGLSHPNVVSVFDSGSDDGTHFIVTELVEGETLADRLTRDGPMPPDEAVDVAVDVCHALEAAHARGLIHRDVKPGNVMLLPDGRVKVVDFGIARAAGSGTLTGTGVVLGSSAYVSPEQAAGGPVDERADLYALGCVLYEMLTGEVPFRGETPVATMYRHVNEEPPPPSEVANVGPELEGVVMRCLEKEPSRRFASAKELEAALLAVPLATSGDTMPLHAADPSAHRTQPLAATPPTDDRPGRRPWLLAGVGVALMLVLAALALAPTSDQLRPRAEARAAARDAAGSATDDVAPAATESSFAEAWTSLVEAIASAQAAGEISDKTADELAKPVTELLNAYRERDPGKAEGAVSRLQEQLAKAVDEGEISPEAAASIDRALLRVVVALEADGLIGTLSAPADEGSAVDEPRAGASSGGEGTTSDEGNGPPAHAEANGHDDD